MKLIIYSVTTMQIYKQASMHDLLHCVGNSKAGRKRKKEQTNKMEIGNVLLCGSSNSLETRKYSKNEKQTTKTGLYSNPKKKENMDRERTHTMKKKTVSDT